MITMAEESAITEMNYWHRTCNDPLTVCLREDVRSDTEVKEALSQIATMTRLFDTAVHESDEPTLIVHVVIGNVRMMVGNDSDVEAMFRDYKLGRLMKGNILICRDSTLWSD